MQHHPHSPLPSAALRCRPPASLGSSTVALGCPGRCPLLLSPKCCCVVVLILALLAVLLLHTTLDTFRSCLPLLDPHPGGSTT